MIRMDKQIQIFEDTQNFYNSDPILKDAVNFGLVHTKLYKADDYFEIPEKPEKLGLALTLNFKSFQAAMKFHKAMPEKKIAVLNFASPIKAGGGVFSGSMAQEESLCRCSTLFPLIDQKWLKENYYIPNKIANDFRCNDSCIYSEGVVICKKDCDYPERLKPEDFINVDIITCAAPDLRYAMRNNSDIKTEELFNIHVNRAKHILNIAAFYGVDILISGAFGCGAFKNNPVLVAEAWHEALKDYQKKFDYIIFAVYFREHEIENFRAFNERFN